jgi:hypothetical protein
MAGMIDIPFSIERHPDYKGQVTRNYQYDFGCLKRGGLIWQMSIISLNDAKRMQRIAYVSCCFSNFH